MTDKAAGKRLRDLIETRARSGDESWEETAARLGVTKQGLFRWFAGGEPSGQGFRAIAQACGVPRWQVVREFDGEE